MGIKITGIEAVMVELRHKAERVADTARKTMHRSADRIEAEAKLNAPVDTEALEDAIHQEVSYGGRGRLQIDIKVGGDGSTNPKTGASVDSYATRVHEDYENIPGAPGPKTTEKRNANPDRYIGEKFLERAFEAEAEKLERRMIENVARELKQ